MLKSLLDPGALWERVRSTYWFVPGLMTFAAIALSFVMIAVDTAIGPDVLDGLGWAYANRAEGARELLGTIAGSVIGVAGVSFSITIATFSQSTTQFGPRLITNFMRDTGNQIVLGTFVGTFAYALMVLRTIQSGDDADARFVPHLAILLALLFALASVAVLIYFIHHIPESINVSNVAARLGRGLAHSLEQRQSEASGQAAFELDLPLGYGAEARPVCSTRAGYVQRIAASTLAEIAVVEDALILLAREPGDFAPAGAPLATVWPGRQIEAETEERIRAAFLIGNERSPSQDLLFVVDELVEMASRALSSGVNDVFTAMACLDWLGNALRTAARAEIAGMVVRDDGGKVRVVGRGLDFMLLLARSCDQLRPYVERDRNASLHLLSILEELARDLPSPEHRRAVAEKAAALHRGARASLTHPDDRAAVDDAFARIEAAAPPAS